MENHLLTMEGIGCQRVSCMVCEWRECKFWIPSDYLWPKIGFRFEGGQISKISLLKNRNLGAYDSLRIYIKRSFEGCANTEMIFASGSK